MLRLLVTPAVFSRGVACARIAAFISATEAGFGVFAVVVVGCFGVVGSRGGVAVGSSTGRGLLSSGHMARSCTSGGSQGGRGSGCRCGVNCRCRHQWECDGGRRGGW